MTDADALLDAIFAHPADDTPRLVYADWLEDHGQANYAAFIRLQCEAARHRLWSPEANRLWEEISPVWNRLAEGEWQHVWAGPWECDPADFDRGFPREPVEWDYAELITRATVCGPLPPLVSVALFLWERPANFDLLDPDHLDHVRVLRTDSESVYAWTTGPMRPWFRHLQVLDLRGGWVDDRLARLLLSASFADRLPRLILPTSHEMGEPTVLELEARFRVVEYVRPLHVPV